MDALRRLQASPLPANLPPLQHMHLGYVPCLRCRLEQPTFTDAVARLGTSIERVMMTIGEVLLPPTRAACEALAALGVEMNRR